jgi:hypothetical protein
MTRRGSLPVAADNSEHARDEVSNSRPISQHPSAEKSPENSSTLPYGARVRLDRDQARDQLRAQSGLEGFSLAHQAADDKSDAQELPGHSANAGEHPLRDIRESETGERVDQHNSIGSTLEGFDGLRKGGGIVGDGHRGSGESSQIRTPADQVRNAASYPQSYTRPRGAVPLDVDDEIRYDIAATLEVLLAAKRGEITAEQAVEAALLRLAP